MSRAESTRLNILLKSFELLYQKGYRATSIDEIIAKTDVTKGAFFFHFKTKEDMGLAVIKDILAPRLLPLLGNYLKKPGDVRDNIYKLMKAVLENDFFKVEFGCPVVNLIEEMSAQDQTFRKELSRIIVMWQAEIESAIVAAQESGQISKDNSPKKIAQYFSANYAGARYLGKLFGKSAYNTFLHEFKRYLENIK